MGSRGAAAQGSSVGETDSSQRDRKRSTDVSFMVRSAL